MPSADSSYERTAAMNVSASGCLLSIANDLRSGFASARRVAREEVEALAVGREDVVVPGRHRKLEQAALDAVEHDRLRRRRRDVLPGLAGDGLFVGARVACFFVFGFRRLRRGELVVGPERIALAGHQRQRVRSSSACRRTAPARARPTATLTTDSKCRSTGSTATCRPAPTRGCSCRSDRSSPRCSSPSRRYRGTDCPKRFFAGALYASHLASGDQRMSPKSPLAVGAEERGLAGGDLGEPEPLILVGVREPLAVGARKAVPPHSLAVVRELPLVADAVRRHRPEFHLAALVADRDDVLAVGHESRLGPARRLSRRRLDQAALLRRHDEHLAARGERRRGRRRARGARPRSSPTGSSPIARASARSRTRA